MDPAAPEVDVLDGEAEHSPWRRPQPKASLPPAWKRSGSPAMTARTRSSDQGTIFFLVAVGSLTDFDLQGFFGSSPSSTAAPRMLEKMSKMPSIVDTSRPAVLQRPDPTLDERGPVEDRSSRGRGAATMWLRTVAS